MKKLIKPLLFTYLFTWIFTIGFYIISTSSSYPSFSKILESLISFLTNKSVLIFIHILFVFFFLILLIIKYFIDVYRKKGLKKCLSQVILRLILPVFILVYGLKYIFNENSKEDFKYEWKHAFENTSGVSKKRFLKDDKIRGMSVYRIGNRHPKKTIKELIKSNVEWVAILPYFYQENENSKKINAPDSLGVWSRRDSSFIKGINTLHKNELFVMLKPHLWMSSGWRSNINFDDKNDWNSWFASYRKNMLHFALLAQETNVDLFCIGTELRSSLQQAPKKWLSLIKEIKTIYKGKITYAANWDDTFEFTEFWNELDYIGIQAYYPLTQNRNPSLDEIKKGWNIHIEKLKTISNTFDKKIIFTEIGYRNDASATKKPWEWNSFFLSRIYTKKSNKTQFLAYKALFDKVWNEPWLAGFFPWEWNSSDFPIYKKPAQNMITIGYAK